MTELIIPSKEMKYIIKIVKSLEKSGSLIKGVVKQFKMKNGYLSILLDTLHASLLGNVLADKGVIWTGEGMIGVIRLNDSNVLLIYDINLIFFHISSVECVLKYQFYINTMDWNIISIPSSWKLSVVNYFPVH